jgi:hypothetical protein
MGGELRVLMLDSRRTGWLGSDSRISSTQSFLLEIRLPLKSQIARLSNYEVF